MSHPCIFTFKVTRALNKLSVEMSFHLRDSSFLWAAKERKQDALIAPQDTYVLIPESYKCCFAWLNGRCMAESSIVRWWVNWVPWEDTDVLKRELRNMEKERLGSHRSGHSVLHIHKPVTIRVNQRQLVVWSSAPWKIQLCSDHGQSPEWEEQVWRGDTLKAQPRRLHTCSVRAKLDG